MPGRSGPPRGATRPVREHVVGGLVLTGVELPLAAVAGAQDYDARQKFVVERGLPARQQSTSSLLLGLKAAVEPSPMQMQSKRREARALQLWAELERRGLAVDRVVAGALLPHVAFAVALHVMGPALVRNQVFRDEPFAADVLEAAQSGWGRLFAALRQSYASESELEEATLRPAPSLSVVTAEHRAEFPPWLDERAESPPDLVADPDLRLAISPASSCVSRSGSFGCCRTACATSCSRRVPRRQSFSPCLINTAPSVMRSGFGSGSALR